MMPSFFLTVHNLSNTRKVARAKFLLRIKEIRPLTTDFQNDVSLI